MRDASDDVLLVAIGQGDGDAFETLMRRHTRTALALAQRMTGSTAEADDVVQEAFLRVWTTAARWRPDQGARFTTWLYRVVVNLCLDRRGRPAAPFSELEEMSDTAPGALDSLAARENREIVAEALAGLPDRQRAAVVLYYFGEMSVPQVCEVLELSVYAVESLLVRGRRAIRTRILERGPAGPRDLL